MKRRFVTFIGGLIIGAGITSTWWAASSHHEQPVLFSPESIISPIRELSLSGDLKTLLSQFSLPQPTYNEEFYTYLKFSGTPNTISDPFTISSPTSRAWVVHAATTLASASAVWAANEMIIYDLHDLRDLQPAEMDVSPTLLYAAICDSAPKEIPHNETNLTLAQEAELFQALRAWDVTYVRNASYSGHPAKLSGLPPNLHAIKLEIASYFNRSKLKKQ